MTGCKLVVREDEKAVAYDLGPEARYALDFNTLRVWDDTHTFLLNTEDLVFLKVLNHGPAKKDPSVSGGNQKRRAG